MKHPGDLRETGWVVGDREGAAARPGIVSEDPEFGDTRIIFHVLAQRTIEEDLDKDEQWGKRMLEIIPRSPQVYLTIPESTS